MENPDTRNVVDRLRLYSIGDDNMSWRSQTMREAADEIESLTAERDRLREALEEIADCPGGRIDEATWIRIGWAKEALKGS